MGKLYVAYSLVNAQEGSGFGAAMLDRGPPASWKDVEAISKALTKGGEGSSVILLSWYILADEPGGPA